MKTPPQERVWPSLARDARPEPPTREAPDTARRYLAQLCEAVSLLARFEGVEAAAPTLLQAVSRAVPLRLGVLIARGPEGAERAVWNARDEDRAAAESNAARFHDLLDAAQGEAGSFAVSARDEYASDLVRDAVEMIRPLAEQKAVALTAHSTDLAARVSCDRERVMQVFSNLIENAIKHTPSGGAIRVRYERGERGARFSVTDNGRGVSPEHRPRLFDRYWRAQTPGRGGVGLGLFIARTIVEAHGGQIGADDAPGGGSVFYFELPTA